MKRWFLYPFLFILYAVLNPLAYNLDQIDPVQSVRPLLVLLLAAALGMLVLRIWVRDWSHAGYLTFLGLVFFLVFGHIHHLLKPLLPHQDSGTILLLLLAGWGILVFGIGFWAWRRFGSRERITPALNLIIALSLLATAIQASGELFASAKVETEEDQPVEEEVPALDCAERPDIYYIILDAYGRADVLDEMYGLKNEPFLSFLEQKGFYVARQSSTNYTQTIFSIPAALNFTYISPNPEGTSGWEYFSDLIANNRLLHLLKSCGYHTVALESGFSFTEQSGVDLYLEDDPGLSEFESLLLAESPLELVVEDLDLEVPDYSYEAHRQRVLYNFEQLRRLPEMPGPKFVFAHIITPHPPFVFDANGKPLEPVQSYSIGDGDDYKGTWQDYVKGYPAQVQNANREMEAVIEAILEGSERPPVIILQGDHGPGGRLDWDSPQKTCLWERTSIFNAYYLPGNKTGQLYPQISPVNSFRVVLNAYFATDLDLLPDKTYFTSHRLERQVIDVTEERNTHQNCAWPGEDMQNP